MAAINILLALIIDNYIIGHSWTNCIIHVAKNPAAMPIQPFANTSNYVISSPTQITALSERCECFILWDEVNSTMQALDEVLRCASNLTQRYNNRKIIAIDDSSVLDLFPKMNSLRFVADFLFIACKNDETHDTYHECTNYDLYTHKYVGIANNEESVFLDSFNVSTSSFQSKVSLFQDKISNQEGRLLRYGIHEFFPVVDLTNRNGCILKTAIEYAKMHNNRFLINGGNYSWIEYFPKTATPNALLMKMSNDDEDILAGATYIRPGRTEKLDMGYIAYQQEVKMVVPKPTEINGWNIFVNEFMPSTWILFAITLLTQTIITLAIQRYNGSESRLNLTCIWGIILQQSVPDPQMPSSHKLRLVICLLYIQSIYYITMWGSLLAVNLIEPIYQNDIKTIKDFADSKLTWGCLSGQIYGLPLSWSPKKHFNIAYNKYVSLSKEGLVRLADNGELVSLTARYNDFYSYENVYDMKSIIKYKRSEDMAFTVFLMPYMRRNSILTNSYILFQIRTWDFGLVDIWNRQSIYPQMMTPLQLYLKYGINERNDIIQLTMVHFVSIFAVWACGMSVAITVFLGEIYIFRRNLKSRI